MMNALAQKIRSLMWLAPALALMTTACGRETKIYKDPKTAEVMIDTTDGNHFLPSGFFDQSVNRAGIDLVTDNGARALRLRTTDQTPAAGAFNDAASTGNRAILGLAKFDQRKLSEISSISIDSKISTGDQSIGLTLIVDLACDRANIHAIEALPSDLDAISTNVDAGYKRAKAALSANIWRSSGAAIADAGTDYLVAHSSASSQSLTDLIAHYPNICIRNAASGADALPKNLPTAGFLLTVGTKDTHTEATVFLNRIAIEPNPTAAAEVLAATDWET